MTTKNDVRLPNTLANTMTKLATKKVGMQGREKDIRAQMKKERMIELIRNNIEHLEAV